MHPSDNNASTVGTTTVVKSDRKWVWRSSLASRAAGQVSVLACMETLGAVALYWLIAYAYETHWHLISSVLIAPLLLLRSPESMTVGVRWFQRDWFGLTGFRRRRNAKIACLIGTVVVVAGVATFLFARWMCTWCLPVLEGRYLFTWAAGIGVSSIVVGIASSFTCGCALGYSGAKATDFRGLEEVMEAALEGTSKGGFAFVLTLVVGVIIALALASSQVGGGLISLAFAFALVVVLVISVVLVLSITTAGPSDSAEPSKLTVAFVFVVAVFLPGVGAGIALRSLLFRVVATLCKPLAGIKRLPENWRENNFLTDSFLPAELMPGIRDHDLTFSMEGFLSDFIRQKQNIPRLLVVLLGFVWFLPAFLYRLNIKATAWFWWPLAYFLQPVPAADTPGEERQALCWPWTNLFQRSLIIVSVVLVIGSLVAHGFDSTSWKVVKDLPALQFVIKVAFAINWAHLAPWHIAQWLIAGAGLGMLWLAGDALSHDRTGNWEAFRRQFQSKIRLMITFRRIRNLGAVTLLVMAIGALLLQDRFWMEYFPVPENWIVAVERFYLVKD